MPQKEGAALHRLRTSPKVRRLVGALGTLFGVAITVFVMLRALPGDQITAAYGIEAAGLTEEQRETLRAYYGLDQPLIIQFFTWLGNVVTGNLGYSSRTNQSVLEMTLLSLPVTLQLAVLSILVALLIGIPLGMLSASRPNAARDWLGQGIGLAGLGVPNFLLATFLLGLAAQVWGFNPNGLGYASPWENLWLNLQQMMMPSLVLGFAVAAPVMRTTRTAVLEVRSLDFIRTAKAKGVPPRRLRWSHILRNALVPVVTMTGMQFGFLLGGAVVMEQIFSLPGLGRQVLLGMNQQEYAVVQSTVQVIALLFVIVNLLTDLLYRKIDPRVRAD